MRPTGITLAKQAIPSEYKIASSAPCRYEMYECSALRTVGVGRGTGGCGFD